VSFTHSVHLLGVDSGQSGDAGGETSSHERDSLWVGMRDTNLDSSKHEGRRDALKCLFNRRIIIITS
jgi:hypothetical protein